MGSVPWRNLGMKTFLIFIGGFSGYSSSEVVCCECSAPALTRLVILLKDSKVWKASVIIL